MERAKLITPKARAKSWKTDLVLRGQRDPVWWISNILGDRLWDKQEEICRSIINNERTAVAAAFGLGKCVEIDERIPLSDGRVVRAGNLIGLHFGVVAFDELTHEQVPSLAWAAYNGVKPVFEIVTKLGRKLIRTSNHPLYSGTCVKVLNRRHVHEIGFKAVENLKVGDAVLITKTLNNNGCIRVDDRDAKLLGYLLGDGGTSVGVSFTQMEGKQKQEFIEIVESFGGRCVRTGDYDLRIRGADVTDNCNGFEKGRNPILNKVKTWGLLGKTSKTKCFPDWVWTLPNDQLALVLNRYFSCDGWAYVNEKSVKRANVRIGVTSASERMIRDVELAMLRFGIIGMVRKKDFSGKIFSKSKNKFYEVRGTYWNWECYKAREIERFGNLIGIFGKELAVEKAVSLSMQRTNFTKTAKWIHEHTTNDFIWDEIVSISPVGDRETVAISVPKYHTYISTIVEHNTHISARLALWFLCNFKPAKVISTGPTLRQVRDLLWKELRNAHQKAKIPLGGTLLQLSLSFNDEHFAVGFSTDETNIDKFTGYHSPNQLVIFDQAAGITTPIWEAAEGLMTSDNCRWLAISNTTISDSELANICMPDRKTRFGKWNVIKIKASESPNVVAGRNIYPGLISWDWVKKREEAWGKDDPLYKIFVEAEFVPNAQMSVVPYRYIAAAFKNEGEMGTSIELGVDVARQGLDNTVFLAKSGTRVLRIKRLTGNNTMEVVGALVEFTKQLKEQYELPISNIKIDIIGIGAGVYDRCIELDLEDPLPVTPINNAESPITDKERYLNLRAEQAWMFRRRMEQHQVGLQNIVVEDYDVLEALRQDISCMKYKLSSNGKIQIWSKEDLRLELGRSPDYWDALVMAFETPGGTPGVEFIEGWKKPEKEKMMSDEEWNAFLGMSVSFDDPSFKVLNS